MIIVDNRNVHDVLAQDYANSISVEWADEEDIMFILPNNEYARWFVQSNGEMERIRYINADWQHGGGWWHSHFLSNGTRKHQ